MKSGRLLLSLVAIPTPVVAASNLDAGDYGLLVSLFLGFGSLIISSKLIPGLLQFAALLKREELKKPEQPVPAPTKIA